MLKFTVAIVDPLIVQRVWWRLGALAMRLTPHFSTLVLNVSLRSTYLCVQTPKMVTSFLHTLNHFQLPGLLMFLNQPPAPRRLLTCVDSPTPSGPALFTALSALVSASNHMALYSSSCFPPSFVSRSIWTLQSSVLGKPNAGTLAAQLHGLSQQH
jgi:hypothetical protein